MKKFPSIKFQKNLEVKITESDSYAEGLTEKSDDEVVNNENYLKN